MATLRDVAQQAGVSLATASRVLNGKASAIQVTAATRQRVLDVSRRLGYRPDPVARALRTKRTRLIGVIVRNAADPFQGLVMRGIDLSARRAGYRALLSSIDTTPAPGEYAQIWQAHNADGVIVVGDVAGDEPSLLQMRERCPCVIATARGKLGNLPRVVVDNHAGMRALLDHLHGLGHRRLAFCYTPDYWDMRDRCAAFVAWARAHDLGSEAAALVPVISGFAGGAHALEVLMARPEPPTAILCHNDLCAVGALKAALARGLQVPRDLSITGFDDIEFAAQTTPGLTTIRQPISQIGETAATLLIAWLERGTPPPELVRLPVELVVRESTASPPEGGHGQHG
ncbi:MAG: LacI family DNA-binding transcriptional regulator [Anaerolineae bacterium]